MKCKGCKLAAWSLAATAVLAGAVWGSGWLWSLRDACPAEELPGTAALSPENADIAGRPLAATLEFELPAWIGVVRAAVEPGEGSVLSGAVKINSSWRWSHRIWRIEATIRPLRSGEIAPGNLAVELSRALEGKSDTAFAAEIPAFRCGDQTAAPASREALQLAAAEEPVRTPAWMYWQFLLLIPLALLIWYFMRRGRGPLPERFLTPWERAFEAISALRESVAANEYPPETGVSGLTDIVRSYLEERFSLPISTRTTPEFLTDLDRNDSPLDAADRGFLRDFMTGADLVKFAKAPAGAEALEAAAIKAEALVEHTVPHTGTAEQPSENGEERP